MRCDDVAAVHRLIDAFYDPLIQAPARAEPAATSALAA